MMKFRINWLSLGDRNATFFHTSDLNKRRKNRILQHQKGNWIWVLSHLRNTYSTSVNTQPSTDSLLSNTDFPSFNTYYSQYLTKIPDEHEIRKAPENLHPLKSPGNDGRHAIFYQTNWDIVKHKLIPEIQHIFSTKTIPQTWDSTLLCLIPRIENAYSVNHFILLGLCNTDNKILTKILVNRIKLHLPSLISPCQGSFTPGRHSSDLFLIAYETIHSMKHSKTWDVWLIFKIDIGKAFDTISWNFTGNILNLYNFPHDFNTLLLSCLKIITYMPKINEEKKIILLPIQGN